MSKTLHLPRPPARDPAPHAPAADAEVHAATRRALLALGMSEADWDRFIASRAEGVDDDGAASHSNAWMVMLEFGATSPECGWISGLPPLDPHQVAAALAHGIALARTEAGHSILAELSVVEEDVLHPSGGYGPPSR